MSRTLGSWVVLGALVLGTAAATKAEETAAPTRSEEALAILKQVDTKIKAVSSVRFQVKSVPSGAATQFVGAGEGTVAMVGWTGQGPQKYLIEAKGERNGQPVHITGGGNGEMFFLIDHRTKKAYEDIDPNVIGSNAGVLFGLAMLEFVHDAPFDDELGADVLELVGSTPVEGEDCHEIRVVYAGGQGESRWFFSKADLLPRRRVQVFDTPQGEGALERTVQAIEIDPELPDALFVMQLPAGYEQIDDFAP